MQAQAAEELRVKRAQEAKGTSRKAYALGQRVDVISAELETITDNLKATNLRLHEAEVKAQTSARKLLSFKRTSSSAADETKQQYEQACDERTLLEEKLIAVSNMVAELKQVQILAEQQAEQEKHKMLEAQATALSEHQSETARMKEEHAKQLATFRQSVGLDPRYKKMPDIEYAGQDSSRGLPNWMTSVTKHVGAVVDGRLQTHEGARAVARGLLRSEGDEGVRRLFDTPELAGVQKRIISGALENILDHWTNRLAVHIWDRLDLSDAKMETLRHLLSFVYNKETDDYEPIKIWTNPNDERDYLVMAKLASRPARKKEFNKMASTCNIIVGADGRCQRDPVLLVDEMYTRFSGAMRTNFSAERPAMPVLYLDATGACLGRGLTHVEAGSADFTGHAKQSRSTLVPLAAYEGSDKPAPLREHLDLVLPAWNKMIAAGKIKQGDASVPSMPITSADMQGTKALYGKRAASNPVWCTCEAGIHQQHKYCTEKVSSYSEMIDYIENTVGCRMSTEDELCGDAHYSPGVARGGRFTSFTCRCCGYSPSEAQWRKDLKSFDDSSDKDQAAERDAHNEIGQDTHPWRRHNYQLKFMPPAVRNGMERAGADNLHLIYLNIFKMLFNYTVHQNLPDSKKKLVKAYLRNAGFYSYDAAAADEENPVMRWIGREVKRFLAEADLHVPFLLRVAAAPPDMMADMADMQNDAGELELEDDDELNLGQVTAEELQQEEQEEPQMMKAARKWDNFLALEADAKKEWAKPEDDTREYREQRAVDFFNAGSILANDLYSLNPELAGWVLHVLCFIVPRQIVSLGEPARRACDACEAIGSVCKKLIRHNTCRRRVFPLQQHAHRSADGNKLWTQTFKKGYIEQMFKRVSVRADLIHGEENQPYLQRADHRLKTTGKATTTADARQRKESERLPVEEAMEVPWVWTQEAALAVWS